MLAEVLSTLRIISCFVQVLKQNIETFSRLRIWRCSSYIWQSLKSEIHVQLLETKDQLVPFSFLLQEMPQMEWGEGGEREHRALRPENKIRALPFHPSWTGRSGWPLILSISFISKKRILENKNILAWYVHSLLLMFRAHSREESLPLPLRENRQDNLLNPDWTLVLHAPAWARLGQPSRHLVTENSHCVIPSAFTASLLNSRHAWNKSDNVSQVGVRSSNSLELKYTI